jgi:hypothetical protein
MVVVGNGRGQIINSETLLSSLRYWTPLDNSGQQTGGLPLRQIYLIDVGFFSND